jgi:hypothetical protein
MVTDKVLSMYVCFLLSGFTIKNIKIKVGTIKSYLLVVNDHYKAQSRNPPFEYKSNSKTARLLAEQERYEDLPERREPLPDKTLARMMGLAKSSDPLGFKAAVWDITGLGRLGGFRQQEFAMDKNSVIKHYVKPDGTLVVRAFCVRNLIFRTEDGSIIKRVLLRKNLAFEVGVQFDIQKNRMNGQIIWFQRDNTFPDYCPVRISLNLLWRAQTLGQGADDPLCVYQDKTGTKCYLSGQEVTHYFRSVVKSTTPNISPDDLKLISCHSIRVKACVLLAEAGMKGWYIKLRLRWLSDCFEVYIRNTKIIVSQHTDALSSSNERLAEVAIAPAHLPQNLVESGILDDSFYILEDDD